MKIIPELMGTKDPLGIAYKLAASNNLLGNGGNIVDNVLGNEEYMKQIMQNPTLKGTDNSRISTRIK